MTLFDRLLRRIMSYTVPERLVRAEAWALGGRHGGRVIEGARAEARLSGVELKRGALLSAVVRSHARSERARAQSAKVLSQGWRP